MEENWLYFVSDGWTDRSKSITNFPVKSVKMTIFIKSIDTFIKEVNKIFELLDDMVMEIREENVVQVVADCASTLVTLGGKLLRKRK